MDEGYILVASGPKKYFDMAANAARSIRHFDPARGICLICDAVETLSDDDRPLFDEIVRLENTDRLRGTEHHIYISESSPFERTLYVDADCLVANNRILEMWDKLSPYKVTFPGRKLTEGVWRRGVDVGRIREILGIDYVVQCNGGVFYFDRSDESKRFFETARSLFENKRYEISVRHHQGKGMANEPIWGSTMAMTKRPIFPLSENLNVSTLKAERWRISSGPFITLWKSGIEFNPVICHFLGLGGPKCPNDLYDQFLHALQDPAYESEGAMQVEA